MKEQLNGNLIGYKNVQSKKLNNKEQKHKNSHIDYLLSIQQQNENQTKINFE